MSWIYLKSFHPARPSGASVLSFHGWGDFWVYIEYGPDRYATRSTLEFENGSAFRYDREHWHDEFGALPDARYDPTKSGQANMPYWDEAQTISREEFEASWERVPLAATYARQLATADGVGPPPWIEIYARRHGNKTSLDT